MAFEIYRNAPITEAVLDIRTRLDAPSMTLLSAVQDAEYSELFQMPNLMAFNFSLDVGQPSVETQSEPLGFSYKSRDGKNIFQVRKDGFSLNRLHPYTEWQSFSLEAKRLWNLYKREARPVEIELVGLTYINQLFLPFGVDFREFFRTYVEVPPELPQTLTSFNFSYQVPLPNEDGFLQISQGYGPFIKPGHSTVILTIQAFRQVNKACIELSEGELWEMLEQLRIAKSQAFEGCITDTVRAMIR